LPIKNADDTLAVQVYDSSLTANTACLPTSDTLKTQIATAVGGSTEQITSLMQNYTLILLALPIAIILSLVFMLFIRLTAGCFIYLLIILSVATLVAFGVYILTQNTNPDDGSISVFDSPTGKVVVAVICFILAILIIVMMFCFRKRINLASSIVKVSARFVASNCGIVLIPILLFIVMVAFLAVWIL
jgi:choline transporter-like protein 2/4/5